MRTNKRLDVARRRKLRAFMTAMAGAGVVGGVVLMVANRRGKGVEQSAVSIPNTATPKILTSGTKKSAATKKTQSIPGPTTLPAVFNPGQMAEDIFRFARVQNITGVLFVLKQIANTTQYSAVSEEFKNVTDKNTFVRYTLVTGLLEKYFAGNSSAKEQIKKEFVRMGLKNDVSGRWSLSGFSVHKDIITVVPTHVKDWMGNRIMVQASTILGDEKNISNGITWFTGIDGKTYQVPTRDVKYL